MDPQIVSWNSDDTINDESNYLAALPPGSISSLSDGTPTVIKRVNNTPLFTYLELNERYLTLEISLLGTIAAQIDAIKAKFPLDGVKKRLVIKDIADGDRRWYIDGVAIGCKRREPNQMIVTLLCDDPDFRAQSETTTTWSITASGQTQAITSVGNTYVHPTITLTPTADKSTGGASRHACIVYTQTAETWSDYGIELTGGWDTATLIAASAMQADGSDIQVLIDGEQSDFWIANINTASTKIWIVKDWLPKQELTLGEALTDSQTVTTLTFQNSAGNISALEAIPSRGLLYIGTELYRYTGKNVTGLKVYGVTRAANNTTAAAHSLGDTCRWIQYEIWLTYGTHLLPAYTVDDDRKPMFNLSTSTNTLHVYDDFLYTGATEAEENRPHRWDYASTGGLYTTTLHTLSESGLFYYYESMDTNAPSTQTDAASKTWSVLGHFFPNGQSTISDIHSFICYNPAGFTQVTTSGKKYYATGANWFTVSAFEKSTDNVTYSNVYTEDAPVGRDASEALDAHTDVSFAGTYSYVRMRTQRSTATGEARWEHSDIDLTLDNTRTPVAAIGSRIVVYPFNFTLSNNTADESISLNYTIPLNDSIEIDCDTLTAEHTNEGQDISGYLQTDAIRHYWLRLSAAANTLQYDDTGTAGVTASIVHRDRNA